MTWLEQQFSHERSRCDRRPSLRFTDRRLSVFALTDRAATIALTNNLLGAVALTTKTPTTAPTDPFLGACRCTDNLEARVQGLAAEPANDSGQRLPTTSATH